MRPADSGRYPSGQRGQTVNLLAYAFGGSNPPLPTTLPGAMSLEQTEGGLKQTRQREARTFLRLAFLRLVTHARSCAWRVTRVSRARRMKEIFGVQLTGGNSSAVERQPSKLGVAGSNPVSRSRSRVCAHVAQSAERVLGKDEVSGSIPDMGSSNDIATANGRA